MNFTIGNKKTFPPDPITGQRLITPADLEEISEFTVSVAGPQPPQWESYEVDFADLAAAGTTNNVVLFELPAGAMIHAAVMKHSAAFGGGALSTYTISVGVTGTATKYAGAFNVFQAAGAAVFAVNAAVGMESFDAPVEIRAFATGSHALNVATAGTCTVYVLMSRLLPAA